MWLSAGYEKEELVISPISVTATADFAAVTAMAVRFYKKYDEEYAVKLEAVSKKTYEAMKKMEIPGGYGNIAYHSTEYPVSEEIKESIKKSMIELTNHGLELYRLWNRYNKAPTSQTVRIFRWGTLKNPFFLLSRKDLVTFFTLPTIPFVKELKV